jgi:hypothetical protein
LIFVNNEWIEIEKDRDISWIQTNFPYLNIYEVKKPQTDE